MGGLAVEKQLRRRIVKQYPPTQCTARSRSTGERCRQFAMVAANTCQKHGSAAKQVREAVQVRVAIADSMLHSPRRSPRAILADAQHLSDLLCQQAIADIDAITEAPSVDALDALTAAIGRNVHIAKINHDAGIDESTLSEEAADLVIGAIMITADLLKIPLSERRARKALALGMKGVDEIGGNDAKARRAYLDRESSRLLALMDASEAAVKAPPLHEVRRDHLAELRAKASFGRCPCCDSLPRDRHSGPAAIEAAAAPMPDPDAPTSPAPPQSPQSPSEGDVIIAEVIDPPRSLPRYPHCQACGGIDDPGHSRFCPGGGGFGSFGAWR